MAQGCLHALASETGLVLNPEAARAMTRLLGLCVPYHVQMFFDHVQRYCRLHEVGEASPALARKVYRTSLLSFQGHPDLRHLEERLETVLDRQTQTLPLALLTETAVVGKLTDRTAGALAARYLLMDRRPEEVQRLVLDILQHDGYLVRKGRCYVFASRLVRDWWKARYGGHYVPAAKGAAHA